MNRRTVIRNILSAALLAVALALMAGVGTARASVNDPVTGWLAPSCPPLGSTGPTLVRITDDPFEDESDCSADTSPFTVTVDGVCYQIWTDDAPGDSAPGTDIHRLVERINQNGHSAAFGCTHSGAQDTGAFLSYGTPGYYAYSTYAEGVERMEEGYTLPFCSTVKNTFPGAGATIVSGGVTYYYWGVAPNGEKPTGILIGGAGEQSSGKVAAVLALVPGGCWQTAP